MDSFSAEFISRFNDKLAKPWSSDGVVFQITNDFVEKTLINVLEAGKSSLEYSRLLIGLACAYDSKPDVRSALRARLAEISRITQEKLTKPSDQFIITSGLSLLLTTVERIEGSLPSDVALPGAQPDGASVCIPASRFKLERQFLATQTKPLKSLPLDAYYFPHSMLCLNPQTLPPGMMDENFKLDDWVSGKATSTPPTCASNTHFHIDHDRSTLAASELRVKLKAKDTVKAAPAAPMGQSFLKAKKVTRMHIQSKRQATKVVDIDVLNKREEQQQQARDRAIEEEKERKRRAAEEKQTSKKRQKTEAASSKAKATLKDVIKTLPAEKKALVKELKDSDKLSREMKKALIGLVLGTRKRQPGTKVKSFAISDSKSIKANFDDLTYEIVPNE